MEMIPRGFPGPERAPSPRISSAEKTELIRQLKSEDKAERGQFAVPETANNTKEPANVIHDEAGIEPLHQRFIVADQDPARQKITALKAEINDVGTDDYLAHGRDKEAQQADRDAYLEKQGRHDAMMRRGKEVRKAREAASQASLFNRFTQSLSDFGKRLLGEERQNPKSPPDSEQTLH